MPNTDFESGISLKISKNTSTTASDEIAIQTI